MPHRRRPDLSLKRLATMLTALAVIGVACGRSSTEPDAESQRRVVRAAQLTQEKRSANP
jgi:hypothetical protein